MEASMNVNRVTVEPVRGTVTTGAAGATGGTRGTLHSRRRRSREELLDLARGIAVGAVPSIILCPTCVAPANMKMPLYNYSTNHVYLHRFSRLRFCVCV